MKPPIVAQMQQLETQDAPDDNLQQQDPDDDEELHDDGGLSDFEYESGEHEGEN